MKAPVSARLRRKRPVILFVVLTSFCLALLPCHADVVTDWDAKASAVASPAALGERELAIVDLAMFDAVNSVARQYRAYLIREDGFGGASAEAAAAGAAATALVKLHPERAADFKSALDDYVKGLSASHNEVEKGIQLGEMVALRVFDSRAADGSTASTLIVHARSLACMYPPPLRWQRRGRRYGHSCLNARTSFVLVRRSRSPVRNGLPTTMRSKRTEHATAC